MHIRRQIASSRVFLETSGFWFWHHVTVLGHGVSLDLLLARLVLYVKHKSLSLPFFVSSLFSNIRFFFFVKRWFPLISSCKVKFKHGMNLMKKDSVKNWALATYPRKSYIVKKCIHERWFHLCAKSMNNYLTDMRLESTKAVTFVQVKSISNHTNGLGLEYTSSLLANAVRRCMCVCVCSKSRDRTNRWTCLRTVCLGSCRLETCSTPVSMVSTVTWRSWTGLARQPNSACDQQEPKASSSPPLDSFSSLRARSLRDRKWCHKDGVGQGEGHHYKQLRVCQCCSRLVL